MRRAWPLLFLPLAHGCHLGDLIGPAPKPVEPPAPRTCILWIVKVDPATGVRFDSTSYAVPCPGTP